MKSIASGGAAMRRQNGRRYDKARKHVLDTVLGRESATFSPQGKGIMHDQPSIYVDFYCRYLVNGISVARIGGGGLDDVLRYIAKPGISVVSSLQSVPDCPTITMGRASVDPELGLIPRELPPLDANGAPFWLFWEANDLTACAAEFICNDRMYSNGGSVLWVRMKARLASEFVTEENIVASLEKSWTEAWPLGSVFVRFEGDAELLAHWTRRRVENFL